jgi:hypothetical protein
MRDCRTIIDVDAGATSQWYIPVGLDMDELTDLAHIYYAANRLMTRDEVVNFAGSFLWEGRRLSDGTIQIRKLT